MKKRDENSQLEMLEGAKLIENIFTNPDFIGLIRLVLLYILVSWLNNAVLAWMVLNHAKSLGIPVRLEYGWLGVRIIPILGNPPTQNSTDSPQSKK